VGGFTESGKPHSYAGLGAMRASSKIYLEWLKVKPPFDDETKRLQLLQRLNQVRGVNIPADAISRRPSISLALLAAPEVMEPFLGVLDWVLDEIRATGAS
jgi:hypothetical protein